VVAQVSLEAVVNALTEPALVVDAEGVIQACNEALSVITGYLHGALVGAQVDQLVPEFARSGHAARRAEFHAAGRSRPMASATSSTYLRRANGTEVPVRVTLGPLRGTEPACVLAVVQDSQVLNRVEADRQRRERLLDRMERMSSLGAWRWQDPEGKLELSPGLLRMIGLTSPAGELSLPDALPFVHVDDRNRALRRMHESYATGRDFSFDARLVRVDGGVIEVHCDGEVDHDGVGRPIGVFAVVQDLTEARTRERTLQEIAQRIQTERALRAERDRAQAFLDVAGVMFIGLDRDGRVMLANKRAAEILECPVDQILGRTWFESFLPESITVSTRVAFDRIMLGEVTAFTRYENPIRTAAGRERLIAWHNSMIRGPDGTVEGTISSGEDITERRQAEAGLKRSLQEIQAMNGELESYAYTVSHDLRTPLRSIQGFAEVLTQDYGDRLPPDALELLARIGTNAERLGELTEHLLALSRVTRAPFARSPVDLALVAREVIDELPGADRIQWNLPESLIVPGDPALLRVVLTNLLENALKFTRDRPDPRIELVEEGLGVVCVRDNGVGFDMAYAGKLFRPFQRLHDRRYPGTGVGLATVARIVERHGGRVWVESEPGLGTTIRLTVGEVTSAGT